MAEKLSRRRFLPIAMFRHKRLNISRTVTIAVLVLVPAGCGIWAAYFAGQDANPDLLTYHFYDAWAILHGRIYTDNAPISLDTFINPIIDIPSYLMMLDWPGRLAAGVLGAMQGFGPVVVYFIARRLRFNLVLSVFAVLVAAIAGGFSSELGNTMGDLLVAVPLLLGVLWVLVGMQLEVEPGNQAGGWLRRWTHRASFWYGIAGAMFGVGLGLKFAEVAFPAAAFGALLVSRTKLRVMAVRIGAAALGVVVGLLVSYGYWGFIVWRRFGDPLAFTTWSLRFFHSPYLPPASADPFDARFEARNALQLLFYPLYWWNNPGLVAEIGIKELSVPVAFVGAWAAIGVGAIARCLRFAASGIRRLRGSRPLVGYSADLARSQDGYVISTFVATMIVWAKLFGIYRYIIVLEILAPVVILCSVRFAWSFMRPYTHLASNRVRWILGQAAPTAMFIGLACLCFATETPADKWTRTGYTGHEFEYQVPSFFENGRLDGVLDLSDEVAFINTLLPAKVIGLGTGLPVYSTKSRARNTADERRILADHGVIAALFYPGPGPQSLPGGNAVLAPMGLYGLKQGPCGTTTVWIGSNDTQMGYCELVPTSTARAG